MLLCLGANPFFPLLLAFAINTKGRDLICLNIGAFFLPVKDIIGRYMNKR